MDVKNRDTEIHLQRVEETHTRVGGCLKEAVTLEEACTGAESWFDLLCMAPLVKRASKTHPQEDSALPTKLFLAQEFFSLYPFHQGGLNKWLYDA
ncbi:hypothetical protein BTVI_08841 [Pitangus sulphuratus]|nr:hypothetical protein BTVI_08841 [Pitangus sulphuratus]